MKTERKRAEREAEEAEELDRREHPEKYAQFDLKAEYAKIRARKGKSSSKSAKRCGGNSVAQRAEGSRVRRIASPSRSTVALERQEGRR